MINVDRGRGPGRLARLVGPDRVGRERHAVGVNDELQVGEIYLRVPDDKVVRLIFPMDRLQTSTLAGRRNSTRWN